MNTRLPDREPRVSRRLLHFFARYAEVYLRRHIHRVRLLKSGSPRDAANLPLVVYLNHAAWWDPLVCLLLARRFFAARQSFAPIDALALSRYRFFSRLGFFPADQTRRGSAEFLRVGEAILSSRANALWITPQGEFTDTRKRPLRFRSGLSHLAVRADRAAFMPLAIDYVFWEERLPEVLVSFGEPLVISATDRLSISDTTQLFESALTSVQDQLSAAAQRRDLREWTTLFHGREGVGGVYQIWSRARARLRGETYEPAHSKL